MSKSRSPIISLLFVALLLSTVGTGALYSFGSPVEERSLPDFPESVYTRQSYFEKINAPIDSAVEMDEELVDEPGEDHMIRVMAVDGKEEIRFFFTHGGDFTVESMNKGDYEISRRKSDGEFASLRIYLHRNEESYLLLEPSGEEYSQMDIYLLGTRMQSDIRVPYSFEELLKISFASLMRSTAGYVDWGFYIPDPIISRLSSSGVLARAIRPYLSSIGDAEDGAIDAEGNYLYIEDGSLQEGEEGLNCSGFAKWVVDGIYYVKTERLLSIEELKTPHPEARGNRWSRKYEEIKQPYFGLDWTRNLALALKRLSEPEADIEAADVDKLIYHEYEEDVGYPISSLKTLLYELAVSEPEYFYLGSVNDLRHGEAELRLHFHVVVFFPWIDSEGRLRVSIMERGEETPIDTFIKSRPDEFVHLVRLKSDGAFIPPNKALDPLLNR